MTITHWTVVALLVVVVLNTLFVAALAVGVLLIQRRMEEALNRAGPLVQQAAETLATVEAATAQLQQGMDAVLERTTGLVDRVSDRVDTATAIAEEVVTEPLIGAASVMAGVRRGLRVYSERATDSGATVEGDGKDGRHS